MRAGGVRSERWEERVVRAGGVKSERCEERAVGGASGGRSERWEESESELRVYKRVCYFF